MRIIVGAHNDCLEVAIDQGVQDITLERRTSTLVTRNHMAVHPNSGIVIHRTKMQCKAFTWLKLWGAERSSVPASTKVAGFANTAGFALRSEWDFDLPPPFDFAWLRPRARRIDREIPLPVQRNPAITFQLGTWMRIAEC
jgi:hypothetical protein